MADESIWTGGVPYVQDGDAVSAAITNPPIEVLAARTQSLRDLVNAIEAGEQITLRNAPLAEGISAGTVVFFDTAALVHDKSFAQWFSVADVVAELRPAEETVYTGIVIQKTADRAGDILVNGYSTLGDSELTNLFGTTTPAAGTYYLSMITPGTVEFEPPAMMVRVLQVLDGGIIRVFSPSHEPISHTHRNYRLQTEDWQLAASFDAAVVPDGATYGYDLTSAEAISQQAADALVPTTGDASFVWLYEFEEGSSSSADVSDLGGLHVNETAINLDSNGIWWFDSAAPEADIDMTVVTADARGVSVISAIQSLSPEAVTVTAANGIVSVQYLEYEEVSGVTGSVVVKQLANHQQRRGSVVEKIVAGRNVILSPSDGQGTVTIEFLRDSGEHMEAMVQNLNNAITSVEEPHVFTLFPSNRTSSVSCRVVLPNLSGAVYAARVFAQFLSPGASQALPTLNVTRTPTPAASGVTPVGPTATTWPNIPSSVTAGDVYYVESADEFSLEDYSQGALAYTMTIASPTPELRMINTGIRIYIP